MKNTACVILAAGLGTRMKSKVPKPLHTIFDRPILEYLLNTVRNAGVEKIVLVLGHRHEEVRKVFPGCDVVVQKEQLGSGDAVNCTRNYFKDFSGDIMVLYSDTPLVKESTIRALLKEHSKGKYGCTMLTGIIEDPRGYGRILRNGKNEIIKIVEEKDASEDEKNVKEINIGAYIFTKNQLFEKIRKVKLNELKKEYYLTEIINIFRMNDIKIGSVTTEDSTEGLGINSRRELAEAHEVIKERVIFDLMENGVTIVDPGSTFIDPAVKIGADTAIYPHTVIEKDVKIASNCKVGPFAHLRPGTELGEYTEIGNYVELCRTKIGKHCKVKHHTYLGDAVLGNNINIGAGTITANYDGKNKNKTYIGDNAFIGVGAILIAPVKIGKGATVGAGSVVTKEHNVPNGMTVVGIPAKIFKK